MVGNAHGCLRAVPVNYASQCTQLRAPSQWPCSCALITGGWITIRGPFWWPRFCRPRHAGGASTTVRERRSVNSNSDRRRLCQAGGRHKAWWARRVWGRGGPPAGAAGSFILLLMFCTQQRCEGGCFGCQKTLAEVDFLRKQRKKDAKRSDGREVRG